MKRNLLLAGNNGCEKSKEKQACDCCLVILLKTKRWFNEKTFHMAGGNFSFV